MIGTSADNNIIKGIPKRWYLHAYMLDTNVTSVQLEQFLREENLNDITCK